MVVPLRDQNGRVRYYLGAQLDVSELVRNSIGLDSLQRLVDRQFAEPDLNDKDKVVAHTDELAEFQQLSETFTPQELQSLLKSQQRQQMDDRVNSGINHSNGQSIRARRSSSKLDQSTGLQGFGSAPPLGFYQNYVLVRPHPSLRILFASPDLRVPGILQSPLMQQIGGSSRVRDDLYHALELGQKVTAKVQWLTKSNHDGRARWIHCTPLISANGLIGVWMVILVDEEEEPPVVQTETQPEPTIIPIRSHDFQESTSWDSAQNNRAQQPQVNDSPSTVDSSQTASSQTPSSQTAFSEMGKPVYEKLPPISKEMPPTVPLPFATAKPKGPSPQISTIDLESEGSSTGWSDPEHPRKSHDALSPSSRHPVRQHYEFLSDFQNFAMAPGPRIAGKAYSINSNSEINNPPPGSNINDDVVGGRCNSISSRGSTSSSRGGGGGDRPLSQRSSIAPPQSQIQPPDLRWRKVDEPKNGEQRRPGTSSTRGSSRTPPINLPGRPSQDSVGRPPVWRTKKSLNPYGYLFND
ncbi:MAG: hypothetical protein Q9222_003279 [Ikaeria aurantiellina]